MNISGSVGRAWTVNYLATISKELAVPSSMGLGEVQFKWTLPRIDKSEQRISARHEHGCKGNHIGNQSWDIIMGVRIAFFSILAAVLYAVNGLSCTFFLVVVPAALLFWQSAPNDDNEILGEYRGSLVYFIHFSERFLTLRVTYECVL